MTIWKWSLQTNTVWACGLGSTHSDWGLVVGFGRHSNKSSGSIKAGNDLISWVSVSCSRKIMHHIFILIIVRLQKKVPRMALEAFHTLPTVLFLSCACSLCQQAKWSHYWRFSLPTDWLEDWRAIWELCWSKRNRSREMCSRLVHGTSLFGLSVGSDTNLRYRQ
jgi:hypothetical protein